MTTAVNKSIQEVYCDDCGVTGNHLMDPRQPIFSYASIAISHEEAKDCVDRTMRDHRVRGRELKFQNLVGYNSGRQAITHILEQYHGRMLVSVFDKKYSLACKLFEYAFEPAVAERNGIFYSIGFHKFIANMLYLHFRAGARFAEEIFEDFEKLMRELSDASVAYLFGAVRLPEADAILDLIRRFCFHNRRLILEELDSLRGHGAGKWVLDLTDTALCTQLGEWGARYNQLDVYCDKTDKLEGFWDIMKTMIGREDRIYSAFIDREQPITFNLLKEISVVNSRDYPGVQLADIAAGATVYALQNRDDQQAMQWMEYLPEMLHLAVMPDPGEVDANKIRCQGNMILLHELVRRSELALSLTEGIGEFLAETTQYLHSKLEGPSLRPGFTNSLRADWKP